MGSRIQKIALKWAAPALLMGGMLISGTTAFAATGVLDAPNGFQTKVFSQGIGKTTNPDDIAKLGGHIFVAYQNGVGPKGKPGKTGVPYSTVVEYDHSGKKVASWKVTGKCDGLTADPANDRMIATVNEDGNTGIYVIRPNGSKTNQVQHVSIHNPLPHGGGLDSITIQNGNIYVSASNPSQDKNGKFTHAALYKLQIKGNTASVQPVMKENAKAVDAVSGKSVTLNLSDPDTNKIVPKSSPKFSGDVMLDSQGDSELIFIRHANSKNQTETRLSLTAPVDGVAWATSPKGTLYVADTPSNKVYAITGHFKPGTVFVTSTNASGKSGFIGTLNLSTGQIHPLIKGLKDPHGLLFVPQSTVPGGTSPVTGLSMDKTAAKGIILLGLGAAGVIIVRRGKLSK